MVSVLIVKNMELLKIRGGNKESFENKQYNIGIGISLGNKWFTVENIVEQIQWVLPYTKESLIIFIADSIHAINIEVKEGISHEEALSKAKEMGKILLEKLREEMQSKNINTTKIQYATWEDITDNEPYRLKVKYLYNLYEKDELFRNKIHKIVRAFTEKDDRGYSDEEINYLGTYVLEELPELLNRAPIKDVVCDAYAYPHDGGVPRLIDAIQQGKKFPEIKENILTTEPKVFLEVR